MPFGVVRKMGTRNHVLDWDPDPSGGGDNSGGYAAVFCKVWEECSISPAKMAEPIEMSFGVVTQMGLRNHY